MPFPQFSPLSIISNPIKEAQAIQPGLLFHLLKQLLKQPLTLSFNLLIIYREGTTGESTSHSIQIAFRYFFKRDGKVALKSFSREGANYECTVPTLPGSRNYL